LEKAGLKTYALVSGWGFPKTYRSKLVLVTFLAAQAPLLATALYLLLEKPRRNVWEAWADQT
jgi:hypothetical protein